MSEIIIYFRTNSFEEFHEQYDNLIRFGEAKEKEEKEYEKGYKILEHTAKKGIFI